MKHSSSKMASKSSIRRERLQRMAEVVQDAAYACSFRTWLPKWQKFDISQSSEAVQFFDDHGWVIFRNVFDATEIKNFRRDVECVQQTSYSGDLLSSRSLGGHRFVLDERIVRIVKCVLRDT